MSYRIEALADDCYPGTSCLINKYDIRDEKQLSFVESRIVIGKTEELLRNPIPGKFNFTHYKSIHRFLFEDIGPVRSVPLIFPKKEQTLQRRLILKKWLDGYLPDWDA